MYMFMIIFATIEIESRPPPPFATGSPYPLLRHVGFFGQIHYIIIVGGISL